MTIALFFTIWTLLAGVFVLALCAAAAPPMPERPVANPQSDLAMPTNETTSQGVMIPKRKRNNMSINSSSAPRSVPCPKSQWLWLLACVGVLHITVASAAAGSNRSRLVEGIVERMDLQNRQMIVALRDPARMWVFDLPRWAPIYKDHRRVSAAEVQTGNRVRVYHRSPLFGDRYSTRVLIVHRP